ncbi:DUF4287 domain-containing protein [Saccharopolyspora taberi]|uniref:DUF4287 domain-containing protein n=1 Tax=Saccharopolyspora taberi TaxID=60895 RepID=A0ABN3VLI8_9PSEU
MPPRRQRDRVSEDALTDRTGRGWDDWFALLDAWGGTGRNHTEIAAHLRDEHGVDGWWAQTVAVAYEQERGMREAHQQADGFTVNASKTINADAAAVHLAVTDDRKRRDWLADAPLRLRTARAPKSARFDWGDHARVNVFVVARGESRCSIQIEHSRLESADDVEPTREYWRARLDDLKSRLE